MVGKLAVVRRFAMDGCAVGADRGQRRHRAGVPQRRPSRRVRRIWAMVFDGNMHRAIRSLRSRRFLGDHTTCRRARAVWNRTLLFDGWFVFYGDGLAWR